MMCAVGDYTYRLAQTLSQDPAIKVAVLTSKKAQAPNSTPAAVEVLPVAKSWSWHEAWSIIKAARAWKPDIVHIQFPSVGFSSRLLPALLPLFLRMAGIQVTQTLHFSCEAKQALRAMPVRLLSLFVVPGGQFVVHDSFQRWMSRWFFRHKIVRRTRTASAIPAVTLTPAERERIRAKYARPNTTMIAYFGFLYPSKGAERLFQIADIESTHIVMVGGFFRESELTMIPPAWRKKNVGYANSIRELAESAPWKDRVTVTGFLPPHEAAAVLAAADAVVLPFMHGRDNANTSVYGAQAQGTFLLTTATDRNGYCEEENTYYAPPHDVEVMKQALKQYAGTRAERGPASERDWQAIFDAHRELYRAQLLTKAKGDGATASSM